MLRTIKAATGRLTEPVRHRCNVLPSQTVWFAVAEFTSKWSLRNREQQRHDEKLCLCWLMSLFLISLTLSFITFLSHKHKRSFIDKGCQRGILQNPPKKKSGMAKGKGWGLRGGVEGIQAVTHAHTHTHTIRILLQRERHDLLKALW
jgi:nitric oxide reductase large subunit